MPESPMEHAQRELETVRQHLAERATHYGWSGDAKAAEYAILAGIVQDLADNLAERLDAEIERRHR